MKYVALRWIHGVQGYLMFRDRVHRWVGICLAFGLAVSGAGCGDGSASQTRPQLRVAAASDLQLALPILAARFKLDSGIEVVSTIGASGTLAEQIKNGAPYDVFLAANVGFVNGLVRENLVKPDSLHTYARGSLALVVPKSNMNTKGIADLEAAEIKAIALANPSFAPYGLAAKQALESAKLWDKLEPKRVLAANVREALQFVESGNAEAAFVGTAAVQGSKTLRVIPINPDLYQPILQGLGVVATSDRVNDAERFTRFLLSETGQGILRDMGFATVPQPELPAR